MRVPYDELRGVLRAVQLRLGLVGMIRSGVVDRVLDAEVWRVVRQLR
ncbi:MAG: hypothetical protein ACJ8AD_04525 [Gemmatimonadaceae bacterium]